LVSKNVALGRLQFDTSLVQARDPVDAVFIAVGTPCGPDRQADLSSVFAVIDELAAIGRGRFVIVTKSTVPVGTGDTIERRLRAAAPQLAVSVASNPEFLREGDAIADFMSPDRIIVGAEDEWGRSTLERLYAPLTDRGARLVSMGRRTAELVKYASNAFLATKISFINEMADLCEAVGADVDDIAMGMGLDHRVGAAFLQAGPGYGGSCFPKDCNALLATAQEHQVKLQVVASAAMANEQRKTLMATRIIEAMGGKVRDRVVSVLGLTFKAGTDDIREAPAIQIVRELTAAGATVKVFDPHGMPSSRHVLGNVKFCASALDCCSDADCVVIATEWKQFRSLSANALADLVRGRILVDLRNIVDRKELADAGFTVHSIGRRSLKGKRATLAPVKPQRETRKRGALAVVGSEQVSWL
jgi:UDPglucose 6-dehydrogenase